MTSVNEALLIVFAMGAVIDRWGYVAAFITGGVFAIAATLLSLSLKSKQYIRDLHDSAQ